MRIGIDIRNVGKNRTGDEAVFFNLTRSFAKIDQQNEYLLFTDILDKNILQRIEESLGIKDNQNFKIVALKTSGIRSLQRYVWNFWVIGKYLRQNPVDIYLTQYITPLFVPKKIKIATIIHDVSFNVYGKFIKFSDLFFLKVLIPLSLKRADKVIGVSKFTADEIIKYYGIDKSKVDWIHNAVGDNFSKVMTEADISSVKNKFGLPEKFILYVGTLQPRKNLPALVEAYARLPEKIGSAVKLVLAGGRGHNYDKRIDEAVKKNSLEERVLFPGYIKEEDKPELFKASLLFCNPSFYEGFGITVLEAMTLGVPVVASDILPHREVAEESIVYCDPENIDALKDQLFRLITDEAARHGLAELEMAQAKHFSWEKSAQKLLSIFGSVT